MEEFYERGDEEKKEIPKHYASEQELLFYNDDLEFMRHHKRTKRNMTEVLQHYLVNSDKRAITSGMKEDYLLNITNVKLNKACSLLHVWWDIIVNPPSVDLRGKSRLM